jgi:hypothetical protein
VSGGHRGRKRWPGAVRLCKSPDVNRIAACATFAISLLAAVPSAAEIGHFVPGLLNIRDYFLPPEPGVYGAPYNYYYSTDRRNDDDGDKIRSVTITPGGIPVDVDVDVDLDLYALAVPIIWASDWKVLGARYGALVAPTFANASVEAALSVGRRLGGDAENASFAVGDLFVQPIWLDWSGKHWEVSAAYAFYAATGKYDTETRFVLGSPVEVEDPDNIGYGFWTHQWQAAGAWYPFENKGTAVTGVATYEYHSEKEDFDVQPGESVTLNWGISQFIPLTSDQHLLLEIGPAGWNGWQVADDDGSDAIDTERDTTHAAGGQLGVTYLPWFLAVNVHGFYEYETQNRFQGYSLGLSLAKKF